jgi:hypothetical protein
MAPWEELLDKQLWASIAKEKDLAVCIESLSGMGLFGWMLESNGVPLQHVHSFYVLREKCKMSNCWTIKDSILFVCFFLSWSRH